MDLAFGSPIPDLAFPGLEGRQRRLGELAAGKPLVLFFFKVECPTCPVAAPVVEKLHRAYVGGGLAVVGISQDGPEPTRAFAARTGMSFPVLSDAPAFVASRAFGLVAVPTLVLVEPGGTLATAVEGFSREDYNRLSERVSRLLDRPYVELSSPGDGLPAFKPG